LPQSIFRKVLFAWSGLGAAFGPALVMTLWWKGTTRNGVVAGMIVGFLAVIIWDNSPLSRHLYSLVPAFVLSAIAVIMVSLLSKRDN